MKEQDQLKEYYEQFEKPSMGLEFEELTENYKKGLSETISYRTWLFRLAVTRFGCECKGLFSFKSSIKIREHVFISGRGNVLVCSFSDNGIITESDKRDFLNKIKGKIVSTSDFLNSKSSHTNF